MNEIIILPDGTRTICGEEAHKMANSQEWANIDHNEESAEALLDWIDEANASPCTPEEEAALRRIDERVSAGLGFPVGSLRGEHNMSKPIYFTIEALKRNAERERRETIRVLLLCALLVFVVSMVIVFHIR